MFGQELVKLTIMDTIFSGKMSISPYILRVRFKIMDPIPSGEFGDLPPLFFKGYFYKHGQNFLR